MAAITSSPVVWGGLAGGGFFALVHTTALGTPEVLRYFAGHPVEYVETILFFIGLAALLLKLADVASERWRLGGSILGPAVRAMQPSEICPGLIAKLDLLPGRRQGEMFIGRLRAAINSVWQRDSADGLDEDLRLLADDDSARVHASYGLFRLIIWAIPILGFLGTVIGITEALANLTPTEASALASTSVQELVQGVAAPAAPGPVVDPLEKVKGGLGVAFDTTTLALSLSIVLMGLQFITDQLENRLLVEVDSRVKDELAGRFERLPRGPEGNIAAVERMSENVLHAVDQLVRRQAELWQSSISAAAGQWTKMADAAGQRLQGAMSASLHEGLDRHAQQMRQSEQTLIEQTRRLWEGTQQSHLEAARATAALQANLVKEVEVLQGAVTAAAEVAQLESALNRNLSALAGAKHFEQTVVSLAAAVNLLSARLADTPHAAVKLESGKRNTMAA